MDIGILGPGRLGRTLDLLLREAGWHVTLLDREQPPADCTAVLLTVPDGAIASVAASLAPGPIVLHTSGSAEVDVLRPHRPAGSWHPLMTFPGPETAIPDLVGVPAAVAGDPPAIEIGRQLSDALGMRAIAVPGDRRLYHCAAVMAGNFATVLLAEAAAVLTRAGVPPEEAAAALAPLALQSIRNATSGPEAALTGPAARGDHETIRAHLAALREAGSPDAVRLYEALNEAALRIAAMRGSAPMARGD